MTTPDTTAAATGPLTERELELDRRIEVLLDESLATTESFRMPADFTARVMADRPFAPWETRRASAWKTPAAVGFGLAAASAMVFLAPVWRLGPATSLAVWAKLLAASVLQPAAQLVAALPILLDEMPKVTGDLSAGPVLALAATAALSVGALIFGLRWRAPAGAVPARSTNS